MNAYTLYPRLDAERASDLRNRLLEGPGQATFDLALMEDMLRTPTAFPATGGDPVTMEKLLNLRERLHKLVFPDTENWGRSPSRFDLLVGRELHQESEGSIGEFGDARVWDFLTLVLLPDFAMERFPKDANGLAARLTGGNRRHVFQRLWRRWQVFGRSIVEASFLTEDDYVALLERRLTNQKKELAQRAVVAIYASGRSGTARREFTRVLMRHLVQTSGLVEISDDDHKHLDALFQHVVSMAEHTLQESSARPPKTGPRA